MRMNSFPDCCGAYVFSKFGHDKTSGHGAEELTTKEIKDFLTEYRKGYQPRIHLIILNQGQLNSIGEKTFLDIGFKIVPLGLYKGHNNNLFLLHYNENEDGNKLK